MVSYNCLFNLHPVGSDYTGVGQRALTFDMENSEFPIAIDIINDNTPEVLENFFGRLSTSDEDVILDPGQTTVHILDDDVIGICLK